MQFFDMTLFILWWVVPAAILMLRAALAAYRTKKMRDQLRELEERSTPLTRPL